MDDERVKEIREKLATAAPGQYGYRSVRADIEYLLAKLDQAGKLAEDLEMLTDQKGEIGSFLKARFPASLKIAQDSLDAWKGTPTPPEAKCEHGARCTRPDPMIPFAYCDRDLPCSIHGAMP